MTDDGRLLRLTALELLAGYADRTLSPVEVHDAVQAVIEHREPVLNALSVRDADASRAQALASEARWLAGQPLGPIDGVPLTLKENIARAGVPMSSGNAGVEPVTPERDAPVTERVRESGGVVIGSTVMPDWGMLSSGVSSRHGVTRSPWDPSLTTGGSSSGAGAAAAAGYGPLHVGTDIGGSIRLPGTWLGLTTLKPSYGRVPLDAPYFGRCAGPMGRSAGDLALFMRVLSRPDARDWTALPPAKIAWAELDLDPSGLRVGLQLDAGCGMTVEPAIVQAVSAAADTFAAAGAVVEPLAAFVTPQMLTDLDLFWRVRSWKDYRALPMDRKQRVLPFIVAWCLGGADVSGARVLEGYQRILSLQAAAVAATQPFDLVLSPVAPVSAFPAQWPMPFGSQDRGMAHIGFTAPSSMSGQPASTVNCGFTADGRTIGVQIVGRRFDDLTVLRATHWYERHRPLSAVPDWPIGRAAGTPVTRAGEAAGRP